MKKTRIIVMLLVISMLALGLAACANGGATTSDTTKANNSGDTTAGTTAGTTAAPSGDVVKLDLWHYFSAADGVVFDDFVKKFNDATPEVQVTSTFVSREDLMKQYTMGAVSGELPDIGMVDNPDMASFITMGVYEDITAQVDAWGEKDMFFEGPLKSCTQDGKIYGLPHNSNCLALFYNKTMLAAAGVEVPTTWDELAAACEKLTQDGVYGLAISAVKNEEGTFQFIPWFLSSNGDIADLGGANTVKALTYLTDLVNNGYMSKDIINWTQGDAKAQFEGGKAAMMVNGPWQVPVLAEEAPDLDYGVALVPKDAKYASVLGGENFGICTGADVDAGFKFLSFIMSADNSADFCELAGKFPPRSDSMEKKPIWTEDPIYSVFGEAMQYAMPRGPHPRWPEISDAMSTAMHESFTGTKTPQQALTDAAAKVDVLLNS